MTKISTINRLLDLYADTVVCFEAQGTAALEQLLIKLQPRKIVVFSGGDSFDLCGGRAFVNKALRQLDLDCCFFPGIEPEPSIETVEKMHEFLRSESPDEVLAVGGGSVLDAAKAAYLLHQSAVPLQDLWGMNVFSGKAANCTLKKVICIPTTAGTGSEVTPYSNIVDRKLQVKKLIVEKEIIPRYSFVVPELNRSMPRAVTLATGCDALAHLIEGFLNVGQDNNNPHADIWAKTGIELVVENLPKVLETPDSLADRAGMSAAATLGGMVIRYKSTGLPHLCSFSWFGRIEHGLAVALLLPECWRYYLGNEAVARKTMQLAGIFGGDTPLAVIDSYCAFIKSCGVKPLREYKTLDERLLLQTAKAAGQNKMKLELAPRPVPLDKSESILREILLKSYRPI